MSKQQQQRQQQSDTNTNNDTHRSTTVREVREVRVTLVLHQPDVDTLRQCADGRSLSFMVRRAIQLFLSRQNKQK
jgi:hypothetical protein